MTQIDIIHTPCRKCVFAQYKNNTQTGCALNYIQAYKNIDGIEILEVYDDEKEFFVVNKKKCIGYREESWFKKFDNANTLQDKIKIYNDHNHIDYLLTINLNNLSRKDIEILFNQINRLSIKPSQLILVRYPKRLEDSEDYPYEWIKSLIDNSDIDFKWRIQTVVDSTVTYSMMLNNIVSVNKKYRFVVSIDQFNNDLSSVIDYANDMVYKQLKTFIVIANKNLSTIIFPSAVYRYSLFMENHNILENRDNYIIV